jgi:NAD(P)H-dependent FMN reductase
MKIEIIAGSPRQESLTARVATYLQKHLSNITDAEVGIIDVRDFELPFVQKVWTSVDAAPSEWKYLAERVFSADAFILVTPEYNGSYSPAMKSLLDHFPKQLHKPFGIVTASPGVMGGMRASQQVISLVAALFGIASPHMLIVPTVDKKFDADGNLTDPTFFKAIELFTNEYIWLVNKIVVKQEEQVLQPHV